jgi:hypothetical protein
LPIKQFGGIGGYTSGHVASDLMLWFKTIDNGFQSVKLKLVHVIPGEIVRKEEKGRGIFKMKGTVTAPMLCLLGTDFIELLKGTICLDFAKNEGTIKS